MPLGVEQKLGSGLYSKDCLVPQGIEIQALPAVSDQGKVMDIAKITIVTSNFQLPGFEPVLVMVAKSPNIDFPNFVFSSEAFGVAYINDGIYEVNLYGDTTVRSGSLYLYTYSPSANAIVASVLTEAVERDGDQLELARLNLVGYVNVS